MAIDVTRNVVAFRLGPRPDDILMADAPTVADDSVQQAWRTVCRQHGVLADEVTALQSEWEPSATDRQFIIATFPHADVTYNFSRPVGDDWTEAMQAARASIAETQTKQAAEDLKEATGDGELLPVLWSASSPGATLLQVMPNWDLIRGKLFLALANVGTTGRGGIGMSHLTWDRCRELGSSDTAAVLDHAFNNLRQGLRVVGLRAAGGTYCELRREGAFVAAAVALPDFHVQFSELLGTDKLLVGLPSQDQLFVAAAGSPQAHTIKQWVLSEGHPVRQLVPTVLSLHRGKMKLIGERAK